MKTVAEKPEAPQTFTLWKLWTSGVSGPMGPRWAMQAWLARDVARRLGTSTGPDDDVRWRGRLVPVGAWVPRFDVPEPADEVIVEKLAHAATSACLDIRAEIWPAGGAS